MTPNKIIPADTLNNGMVNNYNRFISDMSSQLQAQDQKMKEFSFFGMVLKKKL